VFNFGLVRRGTPPIPVARGIAWEPTRCAARVVSTAPGIWHCDKIRRQSEAIDVRRSAQRYINDHGNDAKLQAGFRSDACLE